MESLENLEIVPWSECLPENLDRQRQQLRDLGSCPSCKNLESKAIEDRGWPKPLLSDVQESALGGCQCCDTLHQIVRDFGLLSDLEKKLKQKRVLSSPVIAIEHGSEKLSLWLEVETSRAKHRTSIDIASKSITINRQSKDDEQDWSILHPATYEISDNLGDPRCIEFISTRLSKCLEEQGDEPNSPPTLPRRVLEIEDAQSVRLVETTDQRAHYATLSHRWGKASTSFPKQTKRSNLLNHLSQVPVDDLSSVFQDAIKLTHMLGIQYLWIDSLCIVQDDKQDWINESGKMGNTYGHSTLTIFACSTGGCFVPRTGFQKHTYRCTTFANRSIDITAHSQIQHSHVDSPFREVAADDLFKRGWVFQEWLLCSRAIVFSSNELLWSCDHAICCECRPTPRRPQDIRESWERYQYANLMQTRIVFRSETRQDREEIDWLRLAQAYTTTKLTIQTDRLPALSGLAKRWAFDNIDKHPSVLVDYLAGCWKHQLATSLLWHSVPPRLPSDSKFIDMTRNEYIAPSWSWLSLPYYLKFSFIDTERFREAGFVFRHLITVEKAHCPSASLDPTGAVRDGYLNVTGPAFDAVLMPTSHGKQRPQLQSESMELEGHGDHGSVPFSRLLATQKSPYHVTCLVVRASFVERRARYCEEGLILVQSGNRPSSYERIGLWHTPGTGGNRLHVQRHGPEVEEQFATKMEEDDFDFLLSMLREQKAASTEKAVPFLSEAPQKRFTIV